MELGEGQARGLVTESLRFWINGPERIRVQMSEHVWLEGGVVPQLVCFLVPWLLLLRLWGPASLYEANWAHETCIISANSRDRLGC